MIRPATRADLVAFYGHPPPMTLRALVAVDAEDRPLAVGGYYLKAGVAVAFSDHRTPIRRRDMAIGGRALTALLRGLRMPVLAQADDSAVALQHFGFVPHGALWRLA